MKRRNGMLLAVLFAVAALALAASGTQGAEAKVEADVPTAAPAAIPRPASDNPNITDIVVTQVYSELSWVPQGMFSKFVITFSYLNVASTWVINRMYVDGPDGYQFEIENQPFGPEMNGYILGSNGGVWYMAFDQSGFLKDGDYTISVVFQDGETKTMSRALMYDDAILSSYLQNSAEIVFSPSTSNPSPSAPVPAGTVAVHWSTLKSLGGPDAYYCLRAYESGPSEPGTPIFVDNIFAMAIGDLTYGLNKASIELPELQPDTAYGWWVEICDSNRLRDINICVFQPMQHFMTESASPPVPGPVGGVAQFDPPQKAASPGQPPWTVPTSVLLAGAGVAGGLLLAAAARRAKRNRRS